MKKSLYMLLWAAIAIAIAAAAIWAWRAFKSAPEPDRVTITPARIAEIKSMVELSTIEIYEEMPLKASVGKRHLFAKVTVEGRVAFDLDSLRVALRGDTIFVTLPPAKVELRESTAPNSYVVIDTWNDNPLLSAHFTAAEENEMKTKLLESARRNIHRRGDTARARRDAATRVKSLLESFSSGPVIVN